MCGTTAQATKREPPKPHILTNPSHDDRTTSSLLSQIRLNIKFQNFEINFFINNLSGAKSVIIELDDLIGSGIAVLTEALCVFLKKKCIWMGNGCCNLLAKLFFIILQRLDNN